MRLANVPPPMALHEIHLENNAIDVAITVDYKSTRSVWFAVLHCGGCALYGWPLTSMMHEPPSRKWTVNPNQGGGYPASIFLQAAFGTGSSSRKPVMLLAHNAEASMLSIIDQDGLPRGELCSHDIVIEGIIANGPCSNPGTYIIIAEEASALQAGSLKEITDFNQQSDLELMLPPFAIGRVDAILYGNDPQKLADGKSLPKGTIFSLSENGSLFADHRRLARNCTSFLVTPAHLVYTTSQHLLKFVHIAGSPEGTHEMKFNLLSPLL